MNYANEYQSFLSLKVKYPLVIILLETYDGYLSFDNDAEIINNLFSLDLIKHSKKINFSSISFFQNNALDTFLPQLSKNGYKVGICSQLVSPSEFPKDNYGRTIFPGAYTSYKPSHPWYYHLRGPILLPEYIDGSVSHWTAKDIPKDSRKIEELRARVMESIKIDTERYLNAANLLDPNNIDHCTSISLTHNHVSYNKSFLSFLNRNAPKQASLF